MLCKEFIIKISCIFVKNGFNEMIFIGINDFSLRFMWCYNYNVDII